MKNQGPIVIAAVVAVGLVVACIFAAKALQSPDDVAREKILTQVEIAQRCLHAYNAGGLSALNTLEQWPPGPDAWAAAQEAAADSTMQEAVSRADRQLRPIYDKLDELGVERRPPRAATGSAAVSSLVDTLEDNQALIQRGLDAVNEAMTISGDEVSGRRNLEVARLKALLIHAKADLVRRKAAAQRERARDLESRPVGEHQTSVAREYRRWLDIHREISYIDVELTGTGPAVETRPTLVEDMMDETGASTEPATTGEPAPAGDKEPGLIGGLLKRLVRGKPEASAEPSETTSPEQPETEPADQPVQPEEAEDQREAVVAAPPIPQRLAELRDKKAEVEQNIDNTRQLVDQLQQTVDDLQARLTKAQKERDDARERMLALENKGIDPGKEGSLDNFIDSYRAASAAYQKAELQAETLLSGGLRNVRVDTEDEAKLLTAPLVPAESGEKIVPERGLTAMQNELRVTKELLQRRRDLLAEIERQIANLTERHQTLQARRAELVKQRKERATRVVEVMKSLFDAAYAAEQLEEESLQILTGEGQSAVSMAVSAAASAGRIDSPLLEGNPAVNKLRDTVSRGHVALLEGDMAFQQALVYGQQSDGRQRHARILSMAEDMGLDVRETLIGDRDLADLPEEGAALLTREGALTGAEQAAANAITAGEQAAKVYEEQAGSVGDIWPVHTDIAAVYYLLSQLTPDDAQANTYREQALTQINRALRDRPDQKEKITTYDPIVSELQAASR